MLNQTIDISVIVPIYGVECYVEECLRSLFTQTKTDGVEFILVDDCSPDNSMQIVEKVVSEYPQLDIKIFRHEVNLGLPCVRQAGVDAARGEYIIHIDSDDSVHPHMLSGMFEAALKNNADVVVCDYYTTYTNKKILRRQSVPDSGLECYNQLSRWQLSGFVWNKLIKRSLCSRSDLKYINGINLWEDSIYMGKVYLLAQKIVHHPEAYIYYKKRSSSLSAVLNSKAQQDLIRAVAEIERFLVERQLQDQCKDALNYFKLKAHYSLLSMSSKDVRSQYISLYSGLTPYLKTCPATSKFWSKMIYKRALKGDFLIRDVLFALQRIKRMLVPPKSKLFKP